MTTEPRSPFVPASPERNARIAETIAKVDAGALSDSHARRARVRLASLVGLHLATDEHIASALDGTALWPPA